MCTNVVFGGQFEGSFFSDISWKAHGKRQGMGNTTLTVSGSGPVPVTTNTFTSTDAVQESQKLSSLFSFILRGGILVKPTWLLYLLAGGTEGNFVINNSDFDSFNEQNRGQWDLGYTVGGGVEHKFNQNWSLRAEYRFMHTDIQRSNSSNSSTSGTQIGQINTSSSTNANNKSTDFNYNLFLLGIVYQF
jgi:opacity protein-like surface antigen